jgi:hypothetical protein
MKHVTLYSEPTILNANTKLVAYMLACILLGICLSVLFPSFDDDDKINRTRRNNERTQPMRVQPRPMRLARTARSRKTAA